MAKDLDDVAEGGAGTGTDAEKAAALARLCGPEPGWQCLIARHPKRSVTTGIGLIVVMLAVAAFIMFVEKPFDGASIVDHLRMHNGLKMLVYSVLTLILTPLAILGGVAIIIDALIPPKVHRGVVDSKDESHDFRQTDQPQPSNYKIKSGSATFSLPEKVWDTLKTKQKIVVEHSSWFHAVHSLLVDVS